MGITINKDCTLALYSASVLSVILYNHVMQLMQHQLSHDFALITVHPSMGASHFTIEPISIFSYFQSQIN